MGAEPRLVGDGDTLRSLCRISLPLVGVPPGNTGGVLLLEAFPRDDVDDRDAVRNAGDGAGCAVVGDPAAPGEGENFFQGNNFSCHHRLFVSRSFSSLRRSN